MLTLYKTPIVAFVALLIVMCLVPAANAAVKKSCPTINVGNGYEATVSGGATCKTAQKIAKDINTNYLATPDPFKSNGFRCTSTSEGTDTTWKCRKNKKRVALRYTRF